MNEKETLDMIKNDLEGYEHQKLKKGLTIFLNIVSKDPDGSVVVTKKTFKKKDKAIGYLGGI